MKSRVKIWTTALAVISLSSCAINHHHTPRPDTNEFDSIAQEFTSNKAISVINYQEDNTEHHYFGSPNQYHANYKTWTDTAKVILERELSARNAAIKASADQSIKLAIVDVQHVGTTNTFATHITLDAKLSNGYEKTYVGVNSVTTWGWNWKRQVDGAVMRAVAELLSDPQVVEFVSE